MLIDTRSNLGLPALQFTRFFVVLVLLVPPQLGGHQLSQTCDTLFERGRSLALNLDWLRAN